MYGVSIGQLYNITYLVAESSDSVDSVTVEALVVQHTHTLCRTISAMNNFIDVINLRKWILN